MKFVFIGLSISSSWGNGHATTYRGLIKELSALGHEVTFLEKNVPYYAANRDMPRPEFCKLGLYNSNCELKEYYSHEVAEADVVIVGSYVSQGVETGDWVVKTARGITAFYDIDTPVTLAKLQRKDYEYLTPDLIGEYQLFLSLSGGPTLNLLEEYYGSPQARPLYCSVDPDLYFPEERRTKWQMGYMGTYSTDRQPTVNELLNKVAAGSPGDKFVVAGPQYPENLEWAQNVERIEHLAPPQHREFYNSQKFTLNVTREDMIKAGYSPSVRLFEAAACGIPIISDYWDGIDHIFEISKEILIAKNASEVLDFFQDLGEEERTKIGQQARKKILRSHTAKARAKELENYVVEIQSSANLKK